jgi:hypothetical protein
VELVLHCSWEVEAVELVPRSTAELVSVETKMVVTEEVAVCCEWRVVSALPMSSGEVEGARTACLSLEVVVGPALDLGVVEVGLRVHGSRRRAEVRQTCLPQASLRRVRVSSVGAGAVEDPGWQHSMRHAPCLVVQEADSQTFLLPQLAEAL